MQVRKFLNFGEVFYGTCVLLYDKAYSRNVIKLYYMEFKGGGRVGKNSFERLKHFGNFSSYFKCSDLF